jgi:hypothetical protein
LVTRTTRVRGVDVGVCVTVGGLSGLRDVFTIWEGGGSEHAFILTD